MTKELYIEALEEEVADYMDAHPNADARVMYDKLADKAYARMQDNLEDMADFYYDQVRLERLTERELEMERKEKSKRHNWE